MVDNITARGSNDVASITPFVAVLQPVCSGNLLPYFLQSDPSKGRSRDKQLALISAMKELEKHVHDVSVVIDYEYINALLTDFNERVTALQVILHSKDFIAMYKEQNKQLTGALLTMKECEGHVHNFNRMKKEYDEWSADMKKTIEEIVLTEFSYRITIKI